MRRDGFTLTELLVSLAVLGIVSVYLTNMLTQQNRAYAVVDQVTEAQSSGRAILDLLERELRGTAGLTPEAAAVCGVDNTIRPDLLFVTDGDAYAFDEDDPATKSYDAAAKISSGFTGTGTADVLRLSSMAPDGVAFYDLDADGTPDSDFRPGGAVIVMDQNNPSRGDRLRGDRRRRRRRRGQADHGGLHRGRRERRPRFAAAHGLGACRRTATR